MTYQIQCIQSNSISMNKARQPHSASWNAWQKRQALYSLQWKARHSSCCDEKVRVSSRYRHIYLERQLGQVNNCLKVSHFSSQYNTLWGGPFSRDRGRAEMFDTCNLPTSAASLFNDDFYDDVKQNILLLSNSLFHSLLLLFWGFLDLYYKLVGTCKVFETKLTNISS